MDDEIKAAVESARKQHPGYGKCEQITNHIFGALIHRATIWRVDDLLSEIEKNHRVVCVQCDREKFLLDAAIPEEVVFKSASTFWKEGEVFDYKMATGQILKYRCKRKQH